MDLNERPWQEKAVSSRDAGAVVRLMWDTGLRSRELREREAEQLVYCLNYPQGKVPEHAQSLFINALSQYYTMLMVQYSSDDKWSPLTLILSIS